VNVEVEVVHSQRPSFGPVMGPRTVQKRNKQNGYKSKMMAPNTETNDDESPIDQQYRPIYMYDEGAGSSHMTTGDIVDRVPRDDQIAALKSIEGDGPVVPDGWFEGYGYGAPLPVVDGVPLTALEAATVIDSTSEGAESSQKLAVDDSLGVVELHRAGAHPTNTSKIKVNERQTEES